MVLSIEKGIVPLVVSVQQEAQPHYQSTIVPPMIINDHSHVWCKHRLFQRSRSMIHAATQTASHWVAAVLIYSRWFKEQQLPMIYSYLLVYSNDL